MQNHAAPQIALPHLWFYPIFVFVWLLCEFEDEEENKKVKCFLSM